MLRLGRNELRKNTSCSDITKNITYQDVMSGKRRTI